MEDLIRRSDAIAILKDLQSKHLQFCLVPFRIAIEKVQAIPSADRPQGKWIKTDRTYCGSTIYKCSVCGADIDEMPTVMGVPKYKYCPYCGARMLAKDTNVPNKKGADDE